MHRDAHATAHHHSVDEADVGFRKMLDAGIEPIFVAEEGKLLLVLSGTSQIVEDAQIAAGVIMDALKEGALSAREAVDLINVVGALTRLTGTIEYIKKVVRREVARSAQTLGFEHFFAGRPADNNYARQMAELNAAEDDAAETDEDELPRHPNEYRSTQDPLYRWNREPFPGTAAAEMPSPSEHPEGDGLQIVADSDDGGRRTEAG